MSREMYVAMTLEEAVDVFKNVRQMLERTPARAPGDLAQARDPRDDELRAPGTLLAPRLAGEREPG